MSPTLFRWEHYADRLLRRIAGAIGLPAAAAPSALVERYGMVPGEEFIRDAWPVLLDAWLQVDRASAAVIAAQLRAQGPGDPAQTGTSAAALMQYLRGCDSSAALHRTVLAVFLATGAAPTSAGAVGPRRRRSRGRKAGEGFRVHVEGLVREVLGVDRLSVEPDGSIRLPGGTASCLQTVDDPPQLRIVGRFPEANVSLALDLGGPDIGAEDLRSALRLHRHLSAILERDLHGRTEGATTASDSAKDSAGV